MAEEINTQTQQQTGERRDAERANNLSRRRSILFRRRLVM